MGFRRLAAILAADVAGYTHRVERDTDGTVAAWRAARDDVLKPVVAENSGRIIKFTGDGFLAEFSSVQDAVACAMAMQEALRSNPLDFRMGVSVGDIVDDGGDVHGEGVNIAARIEALATPGGLCISGSVHDAIRNRIDAEFQDMGEHNVKHVSAPVRIWHWLAVAGDTASPAPAPAPPKETVESSATAGKPGVPDKPSIAVLPFDNMSGDPEQEFFADGMTEDLITDLSKISGLFVVARNSSFAYKGRATDVRAIAKDLGVRYILEGSIRKFGGRVRINAQLIDSRTGGHLWAERYDGRQEDVFELQDEVGAKVVSALSVELTRGERDNLNRVHTHSLEAYELYVRARATPYPPLPERMNAAREMFQEVIELDPEFAGGYTGVSSMLSFGALFSHGDQSADISEAVRLAEKAIALDESFAWAYTALGIALLQKGQHEEAVSIARKAIDLQPNDADGHAYLGLILGFAGQCDDGVAAIDTALRLNPRFIYGPYRNVRGFVQYLGGDSKDAVESFEDNVRRQGPVGPPALCWYAAAYVSAGRPADAERMVARLKRDFPAFTTMGWNLPPLIRDPATRTRFIDDMCAADLP